MECKKHKRNIREDIFRDSSLNRISNVSLNQTRPFSHTFVIDLKQTKKVFSVFGPIICLHFC